MVKGKTTMESCLFTYVGTKHMHDKRLRPRLPIPPGLPPVPPRRTLAPPFARAGAAPRMPPEMAYAQGAAVTPAGLPKDMVWLTPNKNPAGIPAVSLAAMQEVCPTA